MKQNKGSANRKTGQRNSSNQSSKKKKRVKIV